MHGQEGVSLWVLSDSLEINCHSSELGILEVGDA